MLVAKLSDTAGSPCMHSAASGLSADVELRWPASAGRAVDQPGVSECRQMNPEEAGAAVGGATEPAFSPWRESRCLLRAGLA